MADTIRILSIAARLDASPWNGVACTLAATLGTLPVALLGAAAIGRFLPLSIDARFALAFLLVIPLWIWAMCVAFLARSGIRAWGWCIALSTVLGSLVFGL